MRKINILFFFKVLDKVKLEKIYKHTVSRMLPEHIYEILVIGSVLSPVCCYYSDSRFLEDLRAVTQFQFLKYSFAAKTSKIF